jgi:hypothetical protein
MGSENKDIGGWGRYNKGIRKTRVWARFDIGIERYYP